MVTEQQTSAAAARLQELHDLGQLNSSAVVLACWVDGLGMRLERSVEFVLALADPPAHRRIYEGGC